MRRISLVWRLWKNFKLLFMLSLIGVVIYGFWYSRQDEATQRRSQEQAIVYLDWLIELKETNRDMDEALNWIIQKIPASLGNVVVVGDIEGADKYTFAGIPVGGLAVKVIKNKGYVVGYDETMRNPAWVAYRLERNEASGTAERPESFEVDRRTRARVDHGDYTNSGYDRGHMAPNYAIDTVFGEAAQKETFLMSNIVPQKPNLNQGPWKKLEQIVANRYLRDYQEAWLITGPIYQYPIQQMSTGVAIPHAFFKIVMDVVDSGGVRVFAVILEQDALPSEKLSRYLVSIDEVERLTGFDFLSLLDDAAEEALEANVAKRLW